MAIDLKKQAADTVENPDSDSLAFFIDETGHTCLKDSTGTVTSTDTGTTDVIDLDEQVSAPVTAANTAYVYSKDDGGVSELFVKDSSGNEVQVTSGGAVVPGGGAGFTQTLTWNGAAGTPFGNASSTTAAFGELLMTSLGDGESMSITLPAIDASNAGQLITIINVTLDATPGFPNITPASGDSICLLPANTTATYNTPGQTLCVLMSDGISRWVNLDVGLNGTSDWVA